jgi:hypothetical protein
MGAFQIGDAVCVPGGFCPGCMDYTPESMAGLITGTEPDQNVHWMLAEEHPGPYYTVLVDHVHNGTGNLVYAEAELRSVVAP